MKTIQSISEAYSMQPATLSVSTQEKYDKAKEKNISYANELCKKIILETIQISTDKQVSFYVGYNFEDEKIFSYLMDAVNVHYTNLITP